MEGVSRLFGSGLLGLLPPGLEPLRGGAIKKQCPSEQPLDRTLDFGAQGSDDALHPFGLAALFFQLLQIVADRLFTRDRRKRSEYGREEADIMFYSLVPGAEPIRTRIDIDEAAIHFALGWFASQRCHRASKRLVHQHRPIDQGNITCIAAHDVDRHDRIEKFVLRFPTAAAVLCQSLDLFDPQWRKRAGETCRGACGKHKLERIGKIVTAGFGNFAAHGYREPVFGIFHNRRAVQAQ